MSLLESIKENQRNKQIAQHVEAQQIYDALATKANENATKYVASVLNKIANIPVIPSYDSGLAKVGIQKYYKGLI